MKTVTFLIGAYTFTFSGPDWASILIQLNKVQNLHGLASQVRVIGTESDDLEVLKLEDFLNKCCCDSVTRADFENLSVNLSIGSLRTLSVIES